MDERRALDVLTHRLPTAGDDCAVVDDTVLTTDMLHASADFPDGTTMYTAGWRSVGASLSDVAAMGANPTAAVAVYGAPTFDERELLAFVDGAEDVCEHVGAEYVGGDLDRTDELTVSTTALGRTASPILRSGAQPGDAVCVTGTLGRSGVGLRLFERGETGQANDLFRFEPRTEAGSTLRRYATAMMDSSDGLARSLHQLAGASNCGFAVESPLPIDARVDGVVEGSDDRLECGAFFGEDFELVCTMPVADVEDARDEVACDLTRIGTTTESGVTLDGDPLPDRGYTH